MYLAPYTALALFAGIRPHEIQRLTWDTINLVDNEITVTAAQSKTGRKRTITIDEPLKSWLTAYQSEGFIDFKGFKELKKQAGFKTWIHDGMRHTSVSHYFRLTGSYGKTAERHGNSETIIKDHYQGKVTSEQTKQFYGLFPTRHGHGEKIVKLETRAA